MNWLTIHDWNSQPMALRCSSVMPWNGESGESKPMNPSTMARSSSDTFGSSSPKTTSGAQSMSVVAFHWETLPFS